MLNNRITYLFYQHDDGLASLGLVGDHTGAFAGSGEPAGDRSPVQRPSKRQDHRIIPGNSG